MIKSLAAAFAVFLCAGSVSAATLDFTGAGSATATSYTEEGYILTASSPSASTHYGDGGGTSNTFNWHAGGANAYTQAWTLSRIGGGLFDMNSFRLGGLFGSEDMQVYNSNGGAFNLTGNSTYITSSPTWSAVSWVRFSLSDGDSAWLDRIRTTELSAVPGPAALPLAASAMALLGFAGWRRRKA